MYIIKKSPFFFGLPYFCHFVFLNWFCFVFYQQSNSNFPRIFMPSSSSNGIQQQQKSNSSTNPNTATTTATSTTPPALSMPLPTTPPTTPPTTTIDAGEATPSPPLAPAPPMASGTELREIILRSASGFVLTIECGRGRVLYASKSVQRFLDYNADQLMGKLNAGTKEFFTILNQ